MSRVDRFADAKWVLERNQMWIIQAEAKVTAVVAIDTVALGTLAAIYSAAQSKPPFAVLLACTASGFLLVSLLSSAMAVLPRLAGIVESLIYFGKVASISEVDFLTRFKAATDDQLLDDLLCQAHRSAQIALSKHEWVRRSMLSFFFAVMPWATAIVWFMK